MDRVVVYPEVASTAVKVGPAAVVELRVWLVPLEADQA
jgi:hypothetical protein